MVDEGTTMADLKGLLDQFAKAMYGADKRTRFRPGYYPFTEPSVAFDVECLVCGGSGCPACSRTGWMTILGAGMVHPVVLQYGGLDPERYQGFAFGMGVERIANLRHSVGDLRLYMENDLRFLEQFRVRVPLSWLRDYVDIDLDAGAARRAADAARDGGQGHRAVGERLAERRRRRAADRREAPPRRPAVADDRDARRAASRSRSSAARRTSRPGQRVPVALPGRGPARRPADRADREDGRRQQRDALLGRRAEPDRPTPTGSSSCRPTTPLGVPLADLYGDVVLDVDVKPNRGDALSLVGLAREVAAVDRARRSGSRRPIRRRPATPIERLARRRGPRPGRCARGSSAAGSAASPSGRRRIASRCGSGRPACGRSATSSTPATTSCSSSASRSTRSTPPASRGRDGRRRLIVRRAERRRAARDARPRRARRSTRTRSLIADAARAARRSPASWAAPPSEVKRRDDRRHRRVGDLRPGQHPPDGPALRASAPRRASGSRRARSSGSPGSAPTGRPGSSPSGPAAPVAAGRVDTAPDEPEPSRVAFRPARVNRLLGTDAPGGRAARRSSPASASRPSRRRRPIDDHRLGRPEAARRRRAGDDEALVAIVPTWRRDIAIEADVAEEVARVRGYETIPAILPDTPMPPYRHAAARGPRRDPRDARRRRPDRGRDPRARLAADRRARSAGSRRLPPVDGGEPARAAGRSRVTNPLSADHSVLRPALVGSLVEVVSTNVRHGADDVAIFEIGKGYGATPIGGDGDVREWWRLGLALHRRRRARRPGTGPARPYDLDDAKGAIELLAARLGFDAPTYRPLAASRCSTRAAPPASRPVRDGALALAGVVGELHPSVAEDWDLRGARVVVAELRSGRPRRRPARRRHGRAAAAPSGQRARPRGRRRRRPPGRRRRGRDPRRGGPHARRSAACSTSTAAARSPPTRRASPTG